LEKKVTETKKNQNMKAGCIGCSVFLLIAAVIFIVMSVISVNTDKSSKPLTRTERIEKQFSGWDGRHMKLARQVKTSMNNPKSFEHVKTTYVDHGDYLNVVVMYRGENLFGGVVTNSVIARVSLDGEILEIVYDLE